MTEEQAPYHVAQDHAKENHEHLFRVAFGNKNIVRFCERCGQTWLIMELRDLLHPNRSVYCWTEVLEETEAHEKLAEIGVLVAIGQKPTFSSDTYYQHSFSLISPAHFSCYQRSTYSVTADNQSYPPGLHLPIFVPQIVLYSTSIYCL